MHDIIGFCIAGFIGAVLYALYEMKGIKQQEAIWAKEDAEYQASLIENDVVY